MTGATELKLWGNASIYRQTVVGKQRRKQRERRIQEIVLLEKLRESDNVKYHQVHLHWVLPKCHLLHAVLRNCPHFKWHHSNTAIFLGLFFSIVPTPSVLLCSRPVWVCKPALLRL